MDRLIDYIITALTASVKTSRGINQLYHGDPWNIPENSFPCIIVDGISEKIVTIDTENDARNMTIDISVIADARAKFNKATNDFTAKREMEKVIGETNTDMSPKTDTILYCVRHTIDNNSSYVLKADPTVDYQITQQRGFPTLEGRVRIQAQSILYLR